MNKECQLCVKNGVGCESIQKMIREIEELKKAKAHRILMCSAFFIVIGFITISFFVWNLMLRQPIMVQQMPESQLKDLSELFNAQFSNLLTVMGFLITIFGFILPMINLYYQRQTLKEERESIKREVDRSLDVIKEQVKEFDLNLQQAKEERKVEISSVRDSLKETIEDARKDFQQRQDNVDKKLAEHENARNYDNGYFMQQLAMAASNHTSKTIYYCNSLPYFSKCCKDNTEVQRRLISVLEKLKESINKIPSIRFFDKNCFDGLFRQLDSAKDNLISIYPLTSKLDEIKVLLEKKREEMDKPPNEQ